MIWNGRVEFLASFLQSLFIYLFEKNIVEKGNGWDFEQSREILKK